MVLLFLPFSIWQFRNKNFVGDLDFSSTIGKGNAGLEVVTKQVTAVLDVIFAPHRNPERLRMSRDSLNKEALAKQSC